jgi:16S rRNA (guanine527-N7)-methyltransferase
MKDGIELIEHYFPHLNAGQKDQFSSLGKIYGDWNAKINVISRKDIQYLYERHILHSLGIVRVIEFAASSSILDVGTGGGFPGIPLAIMHPDCSFHLVDSIGKKVKVVKAVADSLGLENVTTSHKRAEELSQSYDFVVSRAVTDLPKMMQWLKGKFSKTSINSLDNGLLYLKGGDPAVEGIPERQVYPLSNYFTEDFFDQKLVIHLPNFFSFSQKKPN